MKKRLIDRFSGMFRRDGAAPVSDMLGAFHEEHPAFPLELAFEIACCASTCGLKKIPSYADLRETRPLLEQEMGGERAANLVRMASSIGISEAECRNCANAISERPIEERRAFACALLTLAPLNRPLDDEFISEFKKICAATNLSEDEISSVIEDHMKYREGREKLLNSSAGLAVALIVILIFILAATYLKVVFFGFVLAYLFLPLEKFFERQIFESPIYRLTARGISFIFSPLAKLRNFLASRAGFDKPEKTPEALERAERASLAAKASFMTLVTVIVSAIVIVTLVLSIALPFAVNTGTTISKWAQENDFFKEADKVLNSFVSQTPSPDMYVAHDNAAGTTAAMQEQKKPENKKEETVSEDDKKIIPETASQKPSNIREWLKDSLEGFLMSEKGSKLANYAIGKSGGLLSSVFGILSFVGTVAFDILFTVFFFFFFLMQMAVLSAMNEKRKKEDSPEKEKKVGEWIVKAIFESGWFPLTLENTRQSAAIIINRIASMFDAWVRGYVKIIVIELILYNIIFFTFSVPYAPVLALYSCCTIFLPYIGIACAVILSVCITIAFAGPNLAIALAGVLIGYLLVNAILEQLLLYPYFVGGAIGLTTIETIIVVLFGAVIGGIAGMILAVPAAALLKYLIPMIYNAWDRKKRPEISDNTI